jgi:hypothetical protein
MPALDVAERFVLQIVDPILGEFPGVSQLNDEGIHTMPAFTFEKISPPVRRGPIPPIVKKQRGVIVQILGRFVEARVKRTTRRKQAVIARRKPSGQEPS